MRLRASLFIAASWLTVAMEVLGAPDPKLLLNGVRSVREQLPPSQLHLRATFRSPTINNQSEFLVIFSGARRMYCQTNGGPDNVRILFDGSEVFRYDGINSAIVRDPDTQTPDYLFDPRLLGITTSYTWDGTLESGLYLGSESIRLVGKEEVHGLPAWRVHAVGKYNRELDIWVAADDRFSVYKVVEQAEGLGRREGLSFYNEAILHGLPARVENTDYDIKGQIRFQRTLEVLSYTPHLATSNTSWTLNALFGGVKLPTWVPVTDVRIGAVRGYWRDGELGPPEPWEHKPQPPKLGYKSVTVMVAVVGLLAAAFLWKTGRKV